MTSFEEWLLRLKDIDSDRYLQISEILAREPLQSDIFSARCGHEQIINFACELCGMTFD